jgi:hypothetical protein
LTLTALTAFRLKMLGVLVLPLLIGKVADIDPCGTVTLAGTVTAVEGEPESDTATPPAPAAEVSVIVPVADWPAAIELGATETLLRAGGVGLIVTPPVTVTPE